MSFLRHKDTGAVTFNLDSNGETYQELGELRDANGRPVYEDVGEEDAENATVRVAACVIPPLDVAVDDNVALDGGENIPEGASITSAEYWPDTPIVGADTNTRSILIKDGATTKATRTMVAADGTLGAGGAAAPFTVNSAPVGGGDPLVANSAHAGTGIADPGGIVTVELTLTA